MMGTSVTQGMDATTAFLNQLRKATDEKHTLLESQRLLAALMSNEVTIKQYTKHLLLMHQIHEAFEQKLLPKLSFLFPEVNSFMISHLIAEDLQTLNVQQTALHTGYYTLPGDNPTTGYALGFLYVLEGSKLGGRVIFKHLQKRIGIFKDNGGRFLTGDDSNPGKTWKQFLDLFAAYIAGHHLQDEAIAGANEAFTSIYSYYEANSI